MAEVFVLPSSSPACKGRRPCACCRVSAEQARRGMNEEATCRIGIQDETTTCRPERNVDLLHCRSERNVGMAQNGRDSEVCDFL